MMRGGEGLEESGPWSEDGKRVAVDGPILYSSNCLLSTAQQFSYDWLRAWYHFSIDSFSPKCPPLIGQNKFM